MATFSTSQEFALKKFSCRRKSQKKGKDKFPVTNFGSAMAEDMDILSFDLMYSYFCLNQLNFSFIFILFLLHSFFSSFPFVYIQRFLRDSAI